MTANLVSRRAAVACLSLCVPALLAACYEEPPPLSSFAPLGWDYLPKLRLNVATIDIDDSWRPPSGSHDQGALAPETPVAALRQMGEDRLFAGGGSGQAVFTITDASIVRSRGSYVGTFGVRLDVSSADKRRSGYAEAQVMRTRGIDDDSIGGVRTELYGLIKQMMTDMNVEFEYQIRRSLRDFLLTGTPAAPGPAPVEQQNLAPPAPEPTLVPVAPPRPAATPFASPAPTPLGR